VHLHSKVGAPVFAMASGTLVAARLAEQDKADKHYGSNNFILLLHEFKKKKYYSLYLHLNWEKLEKGNKNLGPVKWLLTEGDKPEIDQALLDKLKSGKVCTPDKAVSAGETIWTLGQYGSKVSRSNTMHWEVFSEELMPGTWLEVIEKTDDFNCDNTEIIKMIDEPEGGIFSQHAPNGNLEPEELVNFYKNPQKCERLRYYACKFILEYAIKWEDAVKKLKGKGWYVKDDVLAKNISTYNFWDEAKDVLPASPKVWHYNPAAFIEQALFTSARARLAGLHFEPDKAFPRSTICKHLNAVADYAKKNEYKAAIILGCANDKDKSATKDKLSQVRADSIVMLLTANKDDWIKAFSEKNIFNNREKQLMLSDLKNAVGTSYFDKPIGDAETPDQITSVKEYQKDNGLKEDGDAGPKTLGAMFDKYYIALKTNDSGLIEVKPVACGYKHQGRPIDHVADIIMFPKTAVPKADAYKGKEDAIWKQWQEAVDFEIPESGAAFISLTNLRWEHTTDEKKQESASTALLNDQIRIITDVSGLSDGEIVEFTFYDSKERGGKKICSINGINQGGTAYVDWIVKLPDKSIAALPIHHDDGLGIEATVQDNKSKLEKISLGLGHAIGDKKDFGTLSDVDLIARTIYGECNDENDKNGQFAVAWTIINRRFVENDFKGWNYRSIVLSAGQYMAIVGDQEETALARKPKINSKAFKTAILAANTMLSYDSRTILLEHLHNPIDHRINFLAKNGKDGKTPYKYGSHRKEIQVSDNVFFYW
jgi:outer membrane protein OmpA-like peptidoglycan-associated protein